MRRDNDDDDGGRGALEAPSEEDSMAAAANGFIVKKGEDGLNDAAVEDMARRVVKSGTVSGCRDGTIISQGSGFRVGVTALPVGSGSFRTF